MKRNLLTSALAVIVALAGSLSAQQPPPSPPAPAPLPAAQQPDRQIPPVTFKVEVNYVEVDAVVTDQQGRFVRDLKKEDFQVLEDGKAQEVTRAHDAARKLQAKGYHVLLIGRRSGRTWTGAGGALSLTGAFQAQ